MVKAFKKSPPWITYYNEVATLFKMDPEVKVEYDEETCKISLYVDNQDKADALTKLLPAEKNFGGQILTIEVIPANTKKESVVTLFERAFDKNPIVKDIVTVEDASMFDASYVVFIAGVAQFHNDELNDLNGMMTILLQDVAKDVFEHINSGIFFCTEELP